MTENDRPVSEHRNKLVHLLDEAIDLIDRHSGVDPGDWSDEDASHAIAILDTIAAAFQRPLEHIYWREVQSVSGQKELVPASPQDLEKLRAHQLAAADMLRRMPSILPHKLAGALAFAFYATAQGDEPVLFRPTLARRRGKKREQVLRSEYQRTLAKNVRYFAGAKGVGIGEAQEHFAEKLGLEPDTVADWDSHLQPTELRLAEEAGRAREKPRWLHDEETLVSAYSGIIGGRKGRK